MWAKECSSFGRMLAYHAQSPEVGTQHSIKLVLVIYSYNLNI